MSRMRIGIDALTVPVRVGLHAHEAEAPQPVALDIQLEYDYGGSQADDGVFIDYEQYGSEVRALLTDRPHTRLLETLALAVARMSFARYPLLCAIEVSLHKTALRGNPERLSVALRARREDFAVPG